MAHSADSADSAARRAEHPPVRVFLLDDHQVVRDGLRSAIEVTEDMDVVGEASTADEALRRIPATRPDVAVLDMRLPDGNGVEVCREIRSQHPETACVMLTSYADEEAMFSAVMAGAAGYVLKEIRSNELIADIRRVAEGASLLDSRLTQRAIEQMRKSNVEDPALAKLTERERKVLDLIAEGLTNRQIAQALYIAEKTVKNYVTNILMKMGLERRTEAAVYAARVQERRTRHAP